ncbi:MAG: hypothetical protein DCF12_00545 [Snowella sp.]|jgi:hypothetical protein|nr:MAG: hypothetical protein DCF12_00545 [Snowella sp.]
MQTQLKQPQTQAIQTQAIQTQPIKITIDVPNFDANGPVGIIIAIAVLVKVLVGNQTTRSHKP